MGPGKQEPDGLPSLECVPPSSLLPRLLLWMQGWIPIDPQLPCPHPLGLLVGKERGILEVLPKSASGCPGMPSLNWE